MFLMTLLTLVTLSLSPARELREDGDARNFKKQVWVRGSKTGFHPPASRLKVLFSRELETMRFSPAQGRRGVAKTLLPFRLEHHRAQGRQVDQDVVRAALCTRL